MVKTCASTGEGPIDACYNAINEITGRDIKLTDYNIRAVTGGRDAIGEVSVRIKCDDKIYMGRGISTDIIESSILAYLSAVNKNLTEVFCREQKISIFDSTLRDGAQSEGISFSLQDKLAVTSYLDNLGIDYIECGNPGSNPKDREFSAR